MYGWTAFPWIGPGRTSATWIVRSSIVSGFVRSRLCICARLSIWNMPTVSAAWISANTAGVVERDAREVDRRAVEPRDPVDALLDAREHPEPEQVDLEEAGVGAGVLVPLAELAPGHRGRLDGDELDERSRGDHHPARVLGDVTRQPRDLRGQELERAPALREELLLGVGECRDLVRDPLGVPAVGHAGEPLELGLRQPERLADVADRAARAVRRKARDERGVLVAVALGDADDQLLADVAREVEVDVRHRRELVVQEASEREAVLDRVDVREPGQVADDRADRAAPSPPRRQEHARRAAAAHLERALPRDLEHLVVEEEEPRQAEPSDQPSSSSSRARASACSGLVHAPYRSPNAWSQIAAS